MRITIVGSIIFHPKFIELKNNLESRGHKVVIPLPNEHYSKKPNIKLKAMEDFNKELIKSEAILVANYRKHGKSNYIGTNSIMEIGMAFNHKKKIYILFNIPENMKDELKAIGAIALKGDLQKLK